MALWICLSNLLCNAQSHGYLHRGSTRPLRITFGASPNTTQNTRPSRVFTRSHSPVGPDGSNHLETISFGISQRSTSPVPTYSPVGAMVTIILQRKTQPRAGLYYETQSTRNPTLPTRYLTSHTPSTIRPVHRIRQTHSRTGHSVKCCTSTATTPSQRRDSPHANGLTGFARLGA